MKNTFNLTKKSDIYLYGDNFIATELFDKLTESGYKVKGILDRKFKIKFGIGNSLIDVIVLGRSSIIIVL